MKQFFYPATILFTAMVVFFATVEDSPSRKVGPTNSANYIINC